MAGSNRKQNSDTRALTDGFSSSLKEYSSALADMNQALEEMQGRRDRLQDLLERKQHHTATIRMKVEAQRVQERGREEQERASLQRIKQLNEELEATKEQLEKTKRHGEELRKLRLKRVNEFEAVMRELSSEFLSLRLLEKGEDGKSEEIAKEVSRLMAEVTALQDEHSALSSVSHDTTYTLPFQQLLTVLGDGDAFLKKVKERITKVRVAEIDLKQQVENMQNQTPTCVT